ncbi:pseudouridine synthase [Alkalimarinus sediminis]|uniref:Dual-specificity RNA pseudouridine synthase RluA n=1 Tax=Alkalimarinus sediminis TaxID=1632866 RepID=A0A9E8HGH1_9ALTE|nr:pseudouridine synthase [Alkalimarinus sediminis]UZW73989.1 pseudouridine synthase [Alkalimarinus sediminis]
MNKDHIPIIYQDDDIIVAVKPNGLLSVPGRAPENKDCLISRIQQTRPEALTVHRLDCETSGVVVLACNKDSQRELSRQFHDRETQKRYIAVVDGLLADDEGEIDLPLIADWPNRPKQMVDFERGKPSQTRYNVISRSNDTTRLELTPITGRSHQLRVHMLSLGHAILGDRLYGCDRVIAQSPRMLLHALELGFTHPTTEQFCVYQYPAEF